MFHEMPVLAILASARSDGHTASLLDLVVRDRAVTRMDLRAMNLTHYEYEQPVDRDDFASIAEAFIAHRVIVVATPVYWYAMSGRLKVLMDRFTDLVTVRKDLGRQLAGRHLFVVVSGTDREIPEGFDVPFRRTAEYLGMKYGGTLYVSRKHAADPARMASEFAQVVFDADREP